MDRWDSRWGGGRGLALRRKTAGPLPCARDGLQRDEAPKCEGRKMTKLTRENTGHRDAAVGEHFLDKTRSSRP